MNTNALLLYECLKNDTVPDMSVLADFMGMKNINNNEHITIILGCYKGLYLKEVSFDILYKCFINNKLDELIHKKYTATKSSYYNQFVDKKIKIGNTYRNYQYLFELDEDEIRDLKKNWNKSIRGGKRSRRSSKKSNKRKSHKKKQF